jgi:hypothetical protein
MIAFTFWSILALTSTGILIRAFVLAYPEGEESGLAPLRYHALQVWILVGLIVWLRP